MASPDVRLLTINQESLGDDIITEQSVRVRQQPNKKRKKNEEDGDHNKFFLLLLLLLLLLLPFFFFILSVCLVLFILSYPQDAFESGAEVTVVSLVKRFKKQLSHPQYKQVGGGKKKKERRKEKKEKMMKNVG